jgi:hypothetical protein
VKQQGFGGRDKMAAINRYGMKVYRSPFFALTRSFHPSHHHHHPIWRGALALTRLDFTRKQSKIERLLFFEKRSRMAWPL